MVVPLREVIFYFDSFIATLKCGWGWGCGTQQGYILSKSAKERYPFLLGLYSNVYFAHIVTLVFALLTLLVPLELLYVSWFVSVFNGVQTLKGGQK